jgi:lipopolysaccharide/colanic/teichoic acid biosynthesis glycosyltransferase
MSLTFQRDVVEKLHCGNDGGVMTHDATWFLPYKSTADTVIAFIMLVLTAPLILFLVSLVKATSRGPAIFKQVRLGRGGRAYELYKIRTMAHDCERLTGPQWATAKDPRVTPLGRFLRRSHLDELPQLWNVICGDMSLVGPRPERPEFVATLEREIPDYRERLNVMPGITGLAQVQLPPDENLDDVRRKVICDLCYIRQMGPWLDLKILMATALKVAGLSYGTTRRILNLPGVGADAPMGAVPLSPDPSSIAHLQST